MDIKFRLGFSGVVFLILFFALIKSFGWEAGFIVGLIFALFVFYLTSDTFKQMQIIDNEKRARLNELDLEQKAIRDEAKQIRMGQLEGEREAKIEHGALLREQGRLREQQRAREIQNRKNQELIKKTQKFYDRKGGVLG